MRQGREGRKEGEGRKERERTELRLPVVFRYIFSPQNVFFKIILITYQELKNLEMLHVTSHKSQVLQPFEKMGYCRTRVLGLHYFFFRGMAGS
jgi:hypothetical protein